MNTYKIERIDRDGQPAGTRTITAATFLIDPSGTLWLFDESAIGGNNQAGARIIFAPGTWGTIELIDPNTAVQVAITRPFASAKELATALDGATITTTHDDKWHPVAGSAVYNTVGVTYADIRAEVGKIMREIN